ncbi:MAG: T9SS type A sorting domain-containing protein [Ignavibacteria bacterium]|jgi:Tol biopolymer transport system component|nr:T9SS type A sorting domain-containing protein [Ignavibacteria bacterium]
MKNIFTLAAIITVYFFLYPAAPAEVIYSNSALTDSLPYIGQTRPDTIPLRFGPSYLITNGSWGWHGSPKFSPDGKEMFFVKYYFNLPAGNAKMYFMKDVNGVWTMPASPSFASDSIDNSPVYFPDGNKLYFSSKRSGEMKYYYVTRQGSSWSQPSLLNMAYQSLPGSLGWDFSISQDSTIYFSLYTQAFAMEIYFSKLVNGMYQTFDRLPSQINTLFNEATPYISPDGKYLIFMSNRTGGYGLHDLYISFRKADSTWTQSQNMGNILNGSHEDSFPWVTFDGKYMFFNSLKTGDLAYNAYWVDSKVIDRFKPVDIKKLNENIPSDFRLYQNYPNPFNPATKIKFELGQTDNGKQKTVTRLVVYDISGKAVQTLLNEMLPPGVYEVDFNGNLLSSGVYFYKLSSGKFSETKRFILLK